MELVLLVGALTAGGALLGVITARERRSGRVTTVELRFGTDLTAQRVEALLSGIAGLPSNAVVQLAVEADAEGIRHFVSTSAATLDTLRSQWRGVLPSLRLDEPSSPAAVTWSTGAVLRLSSRRAVLRADGASESAAASLGALQPLTGVERIRVSWLLGSSVRPYLPEPVSRAHAGGLSLLDGLLGDAPLRPDHLRRLAVKYDGPLVAGIGVVSVAAGHSGRASHLRSRVVSVVRSRGGAHGRLVARRRSAKQIMRLLERRRLTGADVYSPGELAALLSLPIGAPQVGGLTLGAAPILMPSPRIPETGRVLAESTWPGARRALAQPVLGGLSGSLIVGPSGVGKSSLMLALAGQDLRAGRGLLFVDGKGDGAEDLLSLVPDSRRGNVIVIDPGAGGPQPGLRLFAPGVDPHLTADLILNVLAAVAPGEWGPLSARWLRAALLLLAHAPDSSLADLPFVFSDDRFRRRLTALVDDPVAQSTWAAFELMGAGERAHQLAAPLGKIDEILSRRVIRTIVGQSRPKLDMGAVLRDGKAVVVSLSPGRIGGPAARLLGAIVLHQFFASVQARSGIAPAERRPAFVYVDEPAIFENMPVPLDSLYELARGLGCGVVLSAQSLAQLGNDLRAAATTNSLTLVAFRQNAADARLLAPELTGVSSEALQHLGKFEAIMRIGLGPGDVSAPVSARTLPPPEATSDPTEVRRVSAARYGADPADVDAALAKRHQLSGEPDTPVGLLRRSS